jgi:hypothetical protein
MSIITKNLCEFDRELVALKQLNKDYCQEALRIHRNFMGASLVPLVPH